MPHTNRQTNGKHWINAPAAGSLFEGQNTSAGGPCPPTARRIICNTAGNLYLIPVGGAAGAGALFCAMVPGQQIDQDCDGIGSSATGTYTAQF